MQLQSECLIAPIFLHVTALFSYIAEGVVSVCHPLIRVPPRVPVFCSRPRLPPPTAFSVPYCCDSSTDNVKTIKYRLRGKSFAFNPFLPGSDCDPCSLLVSWQPIGRVFDKVLWCPSFGARVVVSSVCLQGQGQTDGREGAQSVCRTAF